MRHPLLRLHDGKDNTSSHLRDKVQFLQTKLNESGFSLDVDGVFGPSTEDAVKRFQRKNNLDDDGIVGSLTWSQLLGDDPPEISKVMETTLLKDDDFLLKQLREIEKAGYQSIIETIAHEFDFQPCVIAGIGSRESHWGLFLKPPGAEGTGDWGKRKGKLPPDGGGFGRGLMQIDYDAHEFAQTGNWKDAKENIRYGTKVLADSRNFIQRKTSYTGIALLRAALAGYNAGPGNALRAIRDGRDIDFYTAGRDYSKDVLNRAGWFQLQGWT
jgi:hypothetical protein